MEATLKKELRRQMASTAYLEADYDRFFLEVAHAIDTIQWLGAKVDHGEGPRRMEPQECSLK